MGTGYNLYPGTLFSGIALSRTREMILAIGFGYFGGEGLGPGANG